MRRISFKSDGLRLVGAQTGRRGEDRAGGEVLVGSTAPAVWNNGSLYLSRRDPDAILDAQRAK
jgi:hypothetical protein